MKKIRSFRDIVQHSFFDKIEKGVSLYVERNFRDMELQSSKVDCVDEAHVQEQELPLANSLPLPAALGTLTL